MLRLALPLALLAMPVLADAPMTAAEFEAYVEGRTLTYGSSGEPYGVEAYHANRRVTWAFVGEDCTEGHWYPQGEDICFEYPHLDAPQCWQFFREPDGLRAVYTNEPGSEALYEVSDLDIGLVCPGYGV